jgi:hypothetical protein
MISLHKKNFFNNFKFQGLLGPLNCIFKGFVKALLLIQGLFKDHVEFKGFSRLRINPVNYQALILKLAAIIFYIFEEPSHW